MERSVSSVMILLERTTSPRHLQTFRKSTIHFVLTNSSNQLTACRKAVSVANLILGFFKSALSAKP